MARTKRYQKTVATILLKGLLTNNNEEMYDLY